MFPNKYEWKSDVPVPLPCKEFNEKAGMEEGEVSDLIEAPPKMNEPPADVEQDNKSNSEPERTDEQTPAKLKVVTEDSAPGCVTNHSPEIEVNLEENLKENSVRENVCKNQVENQVQEQEDDEHAEYFQLMDREIEDLDLKICNFFLNSSNFNYDDYEYLFKKLITEIITEDDYDRIKDTESRVAIRCVIENHRKFLRDDAWARRQDPLLITPYTGKIKDLGLILCFFIHKMPWLFTITYNEDIPCVQLIGRAQNISDDDVDEGVGGIDTRKVIDCPLDETDDENWGQESGSEYDPSNKGSNKTSSDEEESESSEKEPTKKRKNSKSKDVSEEDGSESSDEGPSSKKRKVKSKVVSPKKGKQSKKTKKRKTEHVLLENIPKKKRRVTKEKVLPKSQLKRKHRKCFVCGAWKLSTAMALHMKSHSMELSSRNMTQRQARRLTSEPYRAGLRFMDGKELEEIFNLCDTHRNKLDDIFIKVGVVVNFTAEKEQDEDDSLDEDEKGQNEAQNTSNNDDREQQGETNISVKKKLANLYPQVSLEDEVIKAYLATKAKENKSKETVNCSLPAIRRILYYIDLQNEEKNIKVEPLDRVHDDEKVIEFVNSGIQTGALTYGNASNYLKSWMTLLKTPAELVKTDAMRTANEKSLRTLAPLKKNIDRKAVKNRQNHKSKLAEESCINDMYEYLNNEDRQKKVEEALTSLEKIDGTIYLDNLEVDLAPHIVRVCKHIGAYVLSKSHRRGVGVNMTLQEVKEGIKTAEENERSTLTVHVENHKTFSTSGVASVLVDKKNTVIWKRWLSIRERFALKKGDLPNNFLVTSAGKTVKSFDEDLAKLGKSSRLTHNAVRKYTATGKATLSADKQKRLEDQMCHQETTAKRDYHMKETHAVVLDNDNALQQAHFNVRVQEVILPAVPQYFPTEAPIGFPTKEQVEDLIFGKLQVTNDMIELSDDMLKKIEMVWVEKALPSAAEYFANCFKNKDFNDQECMAMIFKHETWGKRPGRRQELLLHAKEFHLKHLAKLPTVHLERMDSQVAGRGASKRGRGVAKCSRGMRRS